jgi:hypothetical protein
MVEIGPKEKASVRDAVPMAALLIMAAKTVYDHRNGPVKATHADRRQDRDILRQAFRTLLKAFGATGSRTKRLRLVVLK